MNIYKLNKDKERVSFLRLLADHDVMWERAEDKRELSGSLKLKVMRFRKFKSDVMKGGGLKVALAKWVGIHFTKWQWLCDNQDCMTAVQKQFFDIIIQQEKSN